MTYRDHHNWIDRAAPELVTKVEPRPIWRTTYRLWAGPGTVSITVELAGLSGQSNKGGRRTLKAMRRVSTAMTPEQARELAARLNDFADAAEGK
jgi:hypothetical protein